MTRFQRFVLWMMPRRTRASIVRESLRWMVRCLTCDARQSIWSIGGVRWKAASRGKRILRFCPKCQANRWSAVEYEPRGSRRRETETRPT